jgi:hypothetical protein
MSQSRTNPGSDEDSCTDLIVCGINDDGQLGIGKSFIRDVLHQVTSPIPIKTNSSQKFANSEFQSKTLTVAKTIPYS